MPSTLHDVWDAPKLVLDAEATNMQCIGCIVVVGKRVPALERGTYLEGSRKRISREAAHEAESMRSRKIILPCVVDKLLPGRGIT